MAEMMGAAIQAEQCLRGACGPKEPHPRQGASLPDGGLPIIPAKNSGSPPQVTPRGPGPRSAQGTQFRKGRSLSLPQTVMHVTMRGTRLERGHSERAQPESTRELARAEPRRR
jgi:hypothetical protein